MCHWCDGIERTLRHRSDMAKKYSRVSKFFTIVSPRNYPADTRCKKYVILTPKRRRDVVLTPKWRYYCVVCPLGAYSQRHTIHRRIPWYQNINYPLCYRKHRHKTDLGTTVNRKLTQHRKPNHKLKMMNGSGAFRLLYQLSECFPSNDLCSWTNIFATCRPYRRNVSIHR